MTNLVTVLKNLVSIPLQWRELEKRVPFNSVEKFQPLGLTEFMALEIPPREMLLSPILPERSLAMLYAPRGTGKSFLALSIAIAAASGGSLLRWAAPRPRRVLFVDGEMPLPDLQSRLNAALNDTNLKLAGNLKILAADKTERGINLSAAEDQKALEAHLNEVDLLILDNLSTLTSGAEGASDAWLPMQNWLLKLRRQGLAVLLVHHAGVNGKQRGTSRREDALDTVIALRRPADYSPEQGARFEVHMEKARTLVGDGAAPFEACVEPFEISEGASGVRWLAKDLRLPVLCRAAELFKAGHTVRQVAGALGISRSEAGRLRLQAADEGLFEPKREDEGEEIEAVLERMVRLN
jgi:putative DNA primase/helicase